jgi:hypothetical protein
MMELSKIIGAEFEKRHPFADRENEMRTLQIVGFGTWGSDFVADCVVVKGDGTSAMVYLSELPNELKEMAGIN